MFEKYVASWLQKNISGIKFVYIPESGAASVIIEDSATINAFQVEDSISIVCSFVGKSDAANVCDLIKNTFHLMEQENGINRVFVDNVSASIVNQPRQWQYSISVRILHRSDFKWEANK